ncbi:MAG TPA: glutamate--tRNA ligase [Firmicutes bacterium]|nr:glutamate--tRNA ligase [Candidatus Fermentithermobacillaceae bacterium]
MGELRVRFAPSPTGYLHIGGARTALFNYLFARHNGGKFILRIEDTDTERTIEDSAEKMMQSFRWLGLDWDEGPQVGGLAGPYYQSQRQEFYRKYAKILLDKGYAYKCYCTPEELEAEREKARAEKRPPRYSGRCRNLTPEDVERFESEGRKYAIRFRTPDSGVTVVHDLIHGEVAFKNEEISDFVIMKSDGFPTYNFACVIDDWLMGVTHVIRADEHLSNTPKQMMIYRALSAPMPKFAHVPMILAPDRSKLSKRHGAQTVEEFREKGYLPEAILNYIALLGWTPPDATKEILSLDEMIKEFDLSRVSSTPAIYDVQKLTWLNGQYIRQMEPRLLVQKYIPFAVSAGLGSREELLAKKDWLEKIMLVFRERAKTLEELAQASIYFFKAPTEYDEKGIKKFFSKPGISRLLKKGAQVVSAIEDWNVASCEEAYRKLIDEEGIKGGDLIHPTRLALTGRTVGPGLFEIMDILGKQETIARLNSAVEFIEKHGLEQASLGEP